jgi:hypothetical protein
MGVSIAQAQAAFLREGGPMGGTIRPAPNELSDMEKLLSEYITKFLNTAADNLNKTQSVTTGNLLDSLNFEIVSDRNGYTINFTALDYYKFVDKGVQGTGPGSKNITSPYKYKDKAPPVVEILKWLRRNVNAGRNEDQQRKLSKLQKKRRSIKAATERIRPRTLAFLISRKIKRVGLPYTGFWSDAFNDTFKDFGVKMSEALGKTITVNLQQMAKDIKGQGVNIPR